MSGHDKEILGWTRSRDGGRCTPPRTLAVIGALLLAGWTAVGCEGKQATFANAGRLCLFPGVVADGFPEGTMGPFDYPAGERLNAVVVFPTCLSGSCTAETHASCTVEGDGGAMDGSTDGLGVPMLVKSMGSFRETADTHQCTTDCRRLIARCTTGVMSAGTHLFSHGSDRLDVTLPFSGPPPCVGSAQLTPP